MITIDNWDKLITINYKAGMNGDFFSNLICDNFVDVSSEYKKTNKNAYVFENRDVFNSFLKVLSDIQLIVDSEEYVFYSAKNDMYQNLYRIYKDEPIEELHKGISELLFSLYSYRFSDGNYKVANFHNSSQNNILKINNIFPGSKNIILTCDRNYYSFARMLFYYKFVLDNLSKNSAELIVTEETKEDFIKSIFFTMPNFNTHEYPIDIYQLLFCDKNYNDELSEFLNTKITLNKDKINSYKKDHINLFKDWGIDLYQNYTDEEIKQFIIIFLKRYFNV